MAKKRKGKRKRKEPTRSLPHLSVDRILLYLTAFFVFSMPLYIWPTITEYGYAKTLYALVGVSVLLVGWGIGAWLKRGERIRLPWLVFPGIGLVVASLFSLLHATNGGVVIQSLTLFVYFGFIFLLVANLVREKRDVTLLLSALVLSSFFVSLYGLLQYLGVMPGAPNAHGTDAIISVMGNRNYVGGFLAYGLIPSIILLVRLRSRLLRVLAIGLIAFNFGMVMLVNQAGTRVALMVATVVLLGVWAIFRPVEPIRRNRIWLLALLAVLAFTFFVESPSGPLNSVVGLSAQKQGFIARLWARNSGNIRSWDWWVGWEMFKAHPFTGVGLGNYKLNFIPYKAKFLATPQGKAYNFYIARAAQAHDDYVQAAAELGSLGMLAVLGLLVFIPLTFWIRLRRNPDEADRFDLLLLGAGTVTFLVHALVSFPAHLPSSSLVLVLILGLLCSRAYGEEGAVLRPRLSGWPLRAGVVALALAGLCVSVIAVRDGQANILMGQGIQQLQLGNPALAQRTLDRSLRLDFCPRQTYYYLAQAKLQQGDYEGALADLKLCLTRFVDEPVYLTIANLAVNLGDTKTAQKYVTLLIDTEPNASTLLQAKYLNGIIALREGDAQRASSLLEALVKDHPDFERGYIALGDLYRGRGMPVTARKNYETALTLIDKKLTSAQRRLDTATSMSAQEYSSLNGQISLLKQEKQAVTQNLAKLPPA
jgi:O-antigen ligase/Tfp pilus assembly protein PilF